MRHRKNALRARLCRILKNLVESLDLFKYEGKSLQDFVQGNNNFVKGPMTVMWKRAQ